ncbi:MAG: hypothetical protein B7Z55_17810, partial [Planctomycetales bacterium 12-60-4]
MKLGMLQTSDGPTLAGVTLDNQFVDLLAIDPKLPTTLKELLADPNGLPAAANALATGMLKGPFVTGHWLAPIATFALFASLRSLFG